MLFRSSIYSFFFCIVVLCIESGVSKCSAITESCLFLPSFFFSIFVSYILTVVSYTNIYNLYLPSVLYIFLILNVLFLFNFFYLKSIFSDISIATPALFWLLFAWNVFFCPLTFSVICIFVFKLSLLQTEHSWIICFYPFCQSLFSN